MGIDSRLAGDDKRGRRGHRSHVRDIIGYTLPCIYRVTGLEVQVAAATTGPAYKYKWLRPLFVVGFQVMTRTTPDGGATWVMGSLADAGMVDILWTNERHEQIATSGSVPSSFPAAACGSLKKPGYSHRWAQIEMQVRNHEIWTFQVRNLSASAVIPLLAFECIEDDT